MPKVAADNDRAARVSAVDWMRGVVMVLMAVDHAGQMLDPGHLGAQSDSPVLYRIVDPALPLDRFLTRLATHLCAPTFLFLAGVSIALSAAARRSDATFDRHLVQRGVFLVALDLFLLSPAYSAQLGKIQIILQVLFAIGSSMIAMAWLRHLSTRVLAGIAFLLLVGGELLTSTFWSGRTIAPFLPGGLLLSGGFYGGNPPKFLVLYAVLPWLSAMLLGFVFGRFLVERGARAASRWLAFAGVASLACFAAVRGWNGYGNMWLTREDHSLVQWLHVSKYPPSFTYLALTLGVMALVLAVLLRLEISLGGRRWNRNPLLVFGQTALFFYVLHFFLLGGVAAASGWRGLGATYSAAAVVVLLLFPVCLVYRRFEARHRDGWVRYL